MSNSTITLLSDLGNRDTTVTVAKAAFMRRVPASSIVDISHHVAQYDLQQAAYMLRSAYSHFSTGTVHIVMIDVFAGDRPRMLLAEYSGFYFITPDNGVLPLTFGAALQNTRLCHEFHKPYSFSTWVDNAAKVINAIGSNSTDAYPTCDVKEAPRVLQPRILPDGVECNVLYIDRYENVVLDITKEQFDTLVQGRQFKIRIMRMEDITGISNNYNDVGMYDPLCRFNNAGFLEIAFNHGQAASALGLGSFSTGNLRYQTIKILFQRGE